MLARLAQTNDLVIATSAGYGASALTVAKKYPDTFFVVYAYLEDTEGLPTWRGSRATGTNSAISPGR